MKNIAVFFGGKSCEHDISIITGVQVINSLNRKKYNVFPIYISRNGSFFYNKNFCEVKQFINFKENKKNVVFMAGDNTLYQKGLTLKKLAKINCAVIACHGMNGEDGTLQGLLELSGIPYTSSGVLGSAVCMDKIIMKQIFEINNLPIVPYIWFEKAEYENNSQKQLIKIQKSLEFPMIVKPANMGSSIGITQASNEMDLIKGIEIAKCYDTRIIVEEMVANLKEINCACLGYGEDITISNLEVPICWDKFLSFDQKYINYINLKLDKKPANIISKSIRNEVKKISAYAFKKLCCGGVVRIDFLLDVNTEDLYINEINSIPGSFANFLFPKYTFETLLDKLIELAQKKHNEKNACSYTYDSEVLSKMKNKDLLSTKLNK